MGNLQLSGLLDHNEPFLKRNMVEQRLHQRCLARACSATDEAVLPLANEGNNGIPNLLGRVPDSINSSDVNQRLNLRTVNVGPAMDEGAPTTATREPSGSRVLRTGFWLVKSCPRMRATHSMAACRRSLV